MRATQSADRLRLNSSVGGHVGGAIGPECNDRRVKESELRRAADEARTLQAWLDRNPGVRDRLISAQRLLKTYNDSVLAAVEWYSDTFNSFVHSVGGIERIQEAARTAGALLADVYRALPPNWPAGVDYVKVIDLANDGIPVVWVPPGPILEHVVAAVSRPAQLAVLHSHRDELIADIGRVLDEVTHVELGGQIPLAKAALESWSSGHEESAQALAVTVIEAVVTRHYARGRKYEQVRAAAKIDLDNDALSISELRLAVAVAPLSTFYTPWFPNQGEPAPDTLSRHVTVHQADVGHYTSDNALLSIMLLASTLRAFQEMLDERDALAAPSTPGL